MENISTVAEGGLYIVEVIKGRELYSLSYIYTNRYTIVSYGRLATFSINAILNPLTSGRRNKPGIFLRSARSIFQQLFLIILI